MCNIRAPDVFFLPPRNDLDDNMFYFGKGGNSPDFPINENLIQRE
jgi:hypothetical protein